MHQQTQNHPPSKHSVCLHLFSPLPILRLTFLIFLSVASTQQPPQPKTTPLLEALKAEKSANKDKEAILRNHAHYKDQLPGALARKDDKKKVPPAVQAQKVAEGAAAAGNKKAGGKKQQVVPPAAAAAASNQNQKPGQAGLPKSVGNVPGPSNLGAKPPKSARAPRAPPPPQANKPQNVVVPIQTAIQQQPGPSTPQQPPSDGATTPTPRRTRPVIGLASRQFEAALSGVAGGKSRREREREREREKEREEGAVTPTATVVSPSPAPGMAQTPSMAVASTPAGNVKEVVKPGPPTSPRRGRRGSHGGGGGSGGGGVGRPPSAAAVNDTKAPGIIQRADAPLITQKDVPVVGSPVVNPVQNPMRGGRGGGGLRRGRGGMRGRGGAPRGGFGSPQGAVE